jgi:L-alanine-DL-glutamate epimerase-like enolase superfamily enzyme
MLMVDAYWGYAPDEALDLARELSRYDISFFEEPSPQYQLAGLRRLCSQSPIKIAIGERVYTPGHYQLMAELGIGHIFEPDACISGGILACLEIAAVARAHDISIIPHVGSPTAIGLAANLHWAAAARCPLIEYDIYPDLPARDDILVEPLFSMDRIVDGMIQVPNGPGLGLTIDETAFAQMPYVPGRTYAEVFPDHEASARRGLG